MKNEKITTEDGLPDIAQGRFKLNPMIMGLIALVIIIIVSIYFHKKTEVAEVKTPEETYSVPLDHRLEVKKESVQAEVKPQEQPHLTQQQVALLQEKERELQQRLSAPLMLVNNNAVAVSVSNNGGSDSEHLSRDPNTQFMNDVSSQSTEISKASQIGPLNYIIAEGSFIHAIMEPATNSDLPGYLRAIVNEPSYSEDGSQILVPRGTRLLGQYKSGMLQGQSRIFIVWTRLITPSGISLNLGSPGVDSLGVSGLGADVIDRHFWQRFGTATLLSLIGTGTANLGVHGSDQDNSASAYRSAMASSFSQSANKSLGQDGLIAPTLKTYQGKPIMVFVAKDLHFETVMRTTAPRLNVF